MTGIAAVTVAVPDAEQLAAALAAIGGGPEPTWHAAVVAGTGAEGRVCTVAGVEVFEVPESRIPESITLEVADTGAAVARLRAAGFEVTDLTGLPLSASLTVAGIGIRIAAAAAST